METNRLDMIDANALANLQMLMNTGDGRHAVLTELLHSADPRIKPADSPQYHAGQGSVDLSAPEIQGRHGKRIRLLQHARRAKASQSMLPEKILALLDALPSMEKAPLITFAEGLAYHYNNLFMGLIGHISIVMFHIKPAHPRYQQLRECEELILNTAMLIRLMVDVLRRPDSIGETIYPIDLSESEIGSRLLATKPGLSDRPATTAHEINVNEILQIIAGGMAEKLEKILHTLLDRAQRAFPKASLRSRYSHQYRQIRIYLLRGLQIAESLNEYAQRFAIAEERIDLLPMINRLAADYKGCFSKARIKITSNTARPQAIGDHKRLRKAFLELIANACESDSYAHPIQIDIRARQQPGCAGDPGGFRGGTTRNWLRIVINNSTPPDAAAHLDERAFGPFFRLADNHRRRGLGLASAAGIIRRHGGAIRFDDPLDEDVRLSIFLPAA